MNNLVNVYMQARFGKDAVATAEEEQPTRLSVSQLRASPQLKRLRDAIERSIRTEKGLRERAGSWAEWVAQEAGKERGELGRALDIVRAATPGAAPSPAVGFYPHAGLAAGGALAGETLQRLLASPERLAAKLKGTPEAATLLSNLPSWAGKLPIVGQYFKGGIPFSEALLARQAKLRTQLPGKLGWLSRLLGRRAGAIGGIAAATVIPALMNLRRTKQLQAVGGEGGIETTRRLKQNLQQAEMMRRWRQAVLEGMKRFGPEQVGEVPFEPFAQHAPRVDISKLTAPQQS